METIKGIILLSALLLQPSTAKRNIPSFAGPYTVHVDRIVPCDEGATMNWTFFFHLSRYNPYKPNEKQIVTGNFTPRDTFDDTAWADLRFSLRANNEWKSNAFVLRFPSRACSIFRSEFPSFFFYVFKGASRTGPCSFPPATYPVDDPVEWVFPSFKVFPYGFYRANLNVGRAGSKEPSLCASYYTHWVPKGGV